MQYYKSLGLDYLLGRGLDNLYDGRWRFSPVTLHWILCSTGDDPFPYVGIYLKLAAITVLKLVKYEYTVARKSMQTKGIIMSVLS
jgi:hypothetical protein